VRRVTPAIHTVCRGPAVALRATMSRFAPILFAVGCAAPAASRTSTQGTTFAQDTYYTGIVAPYATPEDCEAQASNPITCHLELGFCPDGTAGFSHYDLPEQGDYHLEGPIVVATFETGVIELDTRTGSATNADTTTYILDTAGRSNSLQFDTGTTCPD
jgi:hypothetical protein